MKNLISFLTLAVLTACTCIGQLPDQYIYTGENCEVIIPNYISQIQVTDNCGIDTIFQLPKPGTIIENNTPITISVYDKSGNNTKARFNIIVLDTLCPIIKMDSIMVSNLQIQTRYLLYSYKNAMIDKYNKNIENFSDSMITKLGTHPNNLALVSIMPSNPHKPYINTFVKKGTQIAFMDSISNIAEIWHVIK